MLKFNQRDTKWEKGHRSTCKIYQNYAFAKMIDRGGAKGIASGFKWPVVVIGRDPLEGEVVNAVGVQYSRKASYSVRLGLVNGRRGCAGR